MYTQAEAVLTSAPSIGGQRLPACCCVPATAELSSLPRSELNATCHETELAAAASPYLGSKLGRDADRFVARNQQLLDSGPNAAGYFLGFRIIQRYVEKRGAASWGGGD